LLEAQPARLAPNTVASIVTMSGNVFCHWQYDTFKARGRDRSLAADAFVAFALNPDGTIRQVNMAPVSPATDFSFDFQDLLLTPAKVQ